MMKKKTANAESYKAGAKACGNEVQGGGTNPYRPQSTEARAWDHGYRDRQNLNANRDGDFSRTRSTLHLPRAF